VWEFVVLFVADFFSFSLYLFLQTKVFFVRFGKEQIASMLVVVIWFAGCPEPILKLLGIIFLLERSWQHTHPETKARYR
jgi:hypothetical protein